MSQNIRSHVLLRSLAQWGIFPYFHSTFPNFKLLCNLMNCLHIQICCQNWFFPPLFDWHGYQKEFKRIIFWHFWTILIIFSGNSFSNFAREMSNLPYLSTQLFQIALDELSIQMLKSLFHLGGGEKNTAVELLFSRYSSPLCSSVELGSILCFALFACRRWKLSFYN